MHTLAELQEKQALPLDIKIRLTRDRVRAWIHEYGESGVYISFSGGKDSTVLLDLVRNEFGYKNVPACFVDVPTQYPELMGVRDQDIDKMFSVNSNSQCYKQAGNSIVVTVLMAIFSQLNIKGVTPWNELNQTQREELIERTTI